MAELSKEEMAMMQESAGKNQGGDVTKMAQDVGQGLSQLAEAINASGAATDQDKQKIAQVLEMYIDLVENGLGQAPGQDPEAEAEPEMAQVPADQGRGGVPMGPQSRN